jgi:hypothetical protein
MSTPLDNFYGVRNYILISGSFETTAFHLFTYSHHSTLQSLALVLYAFGLI